jgi:hypothetical protein
MIIRYSNGFSCEATLLSRTETMMRVAIERSDDVLELTRVDGGWIGEDFERIQVEFACTREFPVAETKEEDCICPPELAAGLIRLLFAGENEPDVVPVRRVIPAIDHEN